MDPPQLPSNVMGVYAQVNTLHPLIGVTMSGVKAALLRINDLSHLSRVAPTYSCNIDGKVVFMRASNLQFSPCFHLVIIHIIHYCLIFAFAKSFISST